MRKSEKKGRVVPRADEIAKTGEKGAHRAFSPAPAGRGGGRCCLGLENFEPENLALENLGPENLRLENLGQENLGPENLGQENLGAPNLGPENLGAENLGRPIAQLQPPPW